MRESGARWGEIGSVVVGSQDIAIFVDNGRAHGASVGVAKIGIVDSGDEAEVGENFERNSGPTKSTEAVIVMVLGGIEAEVQPFNARFVVFESFTSGIDAKINVF